MANTRIKDISKTATSIASDDYIAIDGATNGSRKMVRSSVYTDLAAAFVAQPTTYKLAPLNSGTNKIDATYLPTSSDTPKGGWNASTNSPTLIDGTGTAGDYYDVTTPGTQNLGSGSITYTVGDVVKYNGSVWYKIDSVANVLDGYATVATARAALSVNSADEDAQATGVKRVAPYMHFNGTSSVVSVADSNTLSFVTGTDDSPLTIEGWVKARDFTNFVLGGKYETTAATREYNLVSNGADQLEFNLRDTSGNAVTVASTAAITAYENQWIHIAATYGGSGPNSASAFTAAHDEVTLYINGVAVASSGSSTSYGGMSNTTATLQIGKANVTFTKGEIGWMRLHNRELSASEVLQAMRGQLSYADEWGGATATSGTLTVGKRYRLKDWITGDDFTNVGAGSNADGVEFVATGTTPTTWTNSSVVESIGCVADFRAENLIDGKLLDLSSNKFVGTATAVTMVGGVKGIQIDTDGSAAGNKVLSVYDGSNQLFYVTDRGNANVNSIATGASTELTIATGAVTATKSYHTIDTEGDAASDDLDTISGGRAGQILVVQANNSARTVVLKDGTGNLKLSGDISLDNAEDTATLVSDGTNWYLLASSNNGA